MCAFACVCMRTLPYLSVTVSISTFLRMLRAFACVRQLDLHVCVRVFARACVRVLQRAFLYVLVTNAFGRACARVFACEV